jgi:hypothetical protein
VADDFYRGATTMIDQAANLEAADAANVTLVEACWLMVTTSQLSPGNADYTATMRRIDARLRDGQHCPPIPMAALEQPPAPSAHAGTPVPTPSPDR